MFRARRAIKKKLPIKKIVLLLILIIGIAVGVLSYNPQIRTELASIIGGSTQSYDINDYIKAAYTEGNTRYLPIYYNNHKERITAADIRNNFAAKGIEVESISTTTIGTGTVVKTKTTSCGTTYNAAYTIIIYGDIDGNGIVNVLDANRIVSYTLNKGQNGTGLSGAYAKAANVQDISAGHIDVRDADRIVGFVLSHNAVVEILPTSDYTKDQEAPKIEVLGDSPAKVVIGDKYEDAGVKVTDDYDPHVKITASPDPNTIDTSRVGTTVIKYTATDARRTYFYS
ncbi:MAG: hypothetical protein K2H53_04540 [Clostridia bacterium]|nr:hypothetical protein [Clostridia bacterium]